MGRGGGAEEWMAAGRGGGAGRARSATPKAVGVGDPSNPPAPHRQTLRHARHHPHDIPRRMQQARHCNHTPPRQRHRRWRWSRGRGRRPRVGHWVVRRHRRWQAQRSADPHLPRPTPCPKTAPRSVGRLAPPRCRAGAGAGTGARRLPGTLQTLWAAESRWILWCAAQTTGTTPVDCTQPRLHGARPWPRQAAKAWGGWTDTLSVRCGPCLQRATHLADCACVPDVFKKEWGRKFLRAAGKHKHERGQRRGTALQAGHRARATALPACAS